jgi:hypothetical protein
MTLPQCVYCRREFPHNQLTRDHVIAGSWYPRSTPIRVQRITVLACHNCNTNRYSADERYLLLRLSACVDPSLPAAEGVWEQARQAMDVHSAPNEEERRHRQAAWDAFNRDIEEIGTPSDEGMLPAFVSNFDVGSRTRVRIQADRLESVAGKWALGFHSYVWKKPLPIDSAVSVFQLRETDVSDIFSFADGRWTVIDRGPGIRIRYITCSDETGQHTVYEFQIWGRVIAYVSIQEGNTQSAQGHDVSHSTISRHLV